MTQVVLTPLTSEQVLAIESKLSEIKATLPFIAGLSSRDRMKLVPIGRNTVQFVQRVVTAIHDNPVMAPQFVGAQTLENGFELYNQLGAILGSIDQLQRVIADTMHVTGSTTHRYSLDCYVTAKRAAKAGVPGAQVVVDTLKTRWRKTTAGSDLAKNVKAGEQAPE
jgi:hypothetical protein